MVVIRFNPDVTRHRGKQLPLRLSDKVDLLIDTNKEELNREHDSFTVRMIQLYYDEFDVEYESRKRRRYYQHHFCITKH